MPAKDKIQKTFFVTPAQDEFLRGNVARGELSDYVRSLIKADKPDFPDDMPPYGDIERIPEEKLKRGKK